MSRVKANEQFVSDEDFNNETLYPAYYDVEHPGIYYVTFGASGAQTIVMQGFKPNENIILANRGEFMQHTVLSHDAGDELIQAVTDFGGGGVDIAPTSNSPIIVLKGIPVGRRLVFSSDSVDIRRMEGVEVSLLVK